MHYGSVAQTAIAIVVLAVVTLVAMSLGRVDQRLNFVGAALRSIVQLVLVALVVAWVFLHPAGAGLYLSLMVLAAAATSVRRIRCGWRNYGRVLAPLIGGVLLAVIPVVATGALPLATQSILPFTAQVIGGSMIAMSLSGTRFRDNVVDQWDIVEGHIALGANARQSVAELGQVAVGRALIPSLDQTRSAGLVTLPGAFVGMLLGGATPAQAAQIQVLVLVALLAAATSASVGLVWMLAPQFGSLRPS